MRVLISGNAEQLRSTEPHYTVEAEYGEELVEGSILTLAHHGERSGNPCPCLAENLLVESSTDRTIGVSHVDLDTLGGVMSVMGRRPAGSTVAAFWELAAFVDLNGPHKLGEANASAGDVRRLSAVWALPKIYPPRDGTVEDVTDRVMTQIEAVEGILAGDETLLAAGDEFTAGEDALNASSFVKMLSGGIILRQSESFTNHLYVTPSGRVARAVVAHNPEHGSVTASLADPIEGIHIGNLLGEFFSPECGGHAGIGGTERDVVRPLEDARRFASLLADKFGG
jgi:hypothetical protein